MRKVLLRLFLILILSFTISYKSNATVEIGSDFFPAAFALSSSTNHTVDVALKSTNYLMFGGSGFALGPVIQLDYLPPGAKDIILGGGFRFGSKLVIGISGGYFLRYFEGKSGTGYGGAVLIGYQLTQKFRFAIPFVIKSMQSGFYKRTTVDFIPTLGLRWQI